MAQLSDEDLIFACREGDRSAWEILVKRYERLIYAIPRRAGFDQDAAADVFQQVFMLLVKNLHRIKQPSQMQAWLVTTARRETLQMIRRGKREVLMTADDSDDAVFPEISDEAALPDEVILQLETQNRVRVALAIENALANALSHQNRFRESEAIYKEALRRAEQAGLEVTQAELESNLGYLSLFQGRYDRALNLFESSRRRYFAMKMPHQTAIAEQEIADVYLELNLIPEAQKLYQKIIPTFKNLKMNAENARALVFHAKTLTQIGQVSEAHVLLAESRRIYRDEKNSVGEAIVALTEAQIFCISLATGNFARTIRFFRLCRLVMVF